MITHPFPLPGAPRGPQPVSLVLGLLLSLSLSACSSSGGDGLVASLQGCGIATEGELLYPPFYAPNACYRRCLAQASCEELADAFCRSDVDLLAACDRRCAFACDDGSLLAVEQVCDGLTNCADGEDEEGCPGFTCADGTRISGKACDGLWACPDGSDERDCPPRCEGPWQPGSCPPFVCDDGTETSPGARCNDYVQCPDGSDEAGCARLSYDVCGVP